MYIQKGFDVRTASVRKEQMPEWGTQIVWVDRPFDWDVWLLGIKLISDFYHGFFLVYVYGYF